jgi:hypothetical protein
MYENDNFEDEKEEIGYGNELVEYLNMDGLEIQDILSENDILKDNLLPSLESAVKEIKSTRMSRKVKQNRINFFATLR